MSRLKRKDEHINAALKTMSFPREAGFDDVSFVHNALPQIALSKVSTNIKLFNKALAAPVIINAMTGGGKLPEYINESMAIAARETGIGMAVGSQTVALDNPMYELSFRIVRQVNPKGLVIANVGAGNTLEQAKTAIEMIRADALQIHLNAPQELIMSEGERNLEKWSENIAKIAEGLQVPVIIKEVGFGLGHETVRKLAALGVRNFDVGGKGGTNFIRIERERKNNKNDWLDDWGIPTVNSLIEILHTGAAEHVIATGGVKDGLDAAKGLALGATAVGIAGVYLKYLFDRNIGGLIERIESTKNQLKKIMFLTGADRPELLRKIPVVITGSTREWLHERGIDTSNYARRE